MPRLTLTPSGVTSLLSRTTITSTRHLSTSSALLAGKQNATPGWEGRPGDDHVVNRSEHDVQADASHQGMRDKQGKEPNRAGGQGISERDEGNQNKKAKEDHPEAPEPVIGMNSERGAKGHK